MKTIYDISPRISEKTPVWPGDTVFSRKVQLSLDKGDSVELSSITTTLHIGAHADAPNHYAQEAPGIDELDLEPYLGRCRVVTVQTSDAITLSNCAGVDELVEQGIKRVLFRTLSFSLTPPFATDFAYFDPEFVGELGKAGIKLIGIDTPSVDPFHSKDLPAHAKLREYDMRNLEGIVLKDVADGDYELIALPLKLGHCDASPVRAVLREI